MAKKIQKILIDANAFISLNWLHDSNHQKTKEIFQRLKKKKCQLWTNNYLVAEVLTVLLQKLKDVRAVSQTGYQFYSPSKYLKTYQITLKIQQKSLSIFSQQEKPKLSFPDCTLVAQAIDQKITTIFTFDRNIKKFPLFKKNFKFIS